MRNKNTHSLTIKGKLNKKKGVFVAFNQLQFKYKGSLNNKESLFYLKKYINLV